MNNIATGTFLAAVVAASAIAMYGLMSPPPRPKPNIFPEQYRVYIIDDSNMRVYKAYAAEMLDSSSVDITLTNGETINVSNADHIEIIDYYERR